MALVSDRCEFPLLRNRFWPHAIRQTRAAENTSLNGLPLDLPLPTPPTLAGPILPVGNLERIKTLDLPTVCIDLTGRNGSSGTGNDAALDGPQPDRSSSPTQQGRSQHGTARGGVGRALGVQSLDISMLTRAGGNGTDGSSPTGADDGTVRSAAF